MPIRSKMSRNNGKKKVLSIAKSDLLRRARQMDLRRAGYAVSSVTDFSQIENLSKSETFDVAIVGYAFHPEVKKLIADIVRKYFPSTPIVELTRAHPEIPDSIPSTPQPARMKATLRAVLQGRPASKASRSN